MPDAVSRSWLWNAPVPLPARPVLTRSLWPWLVLAGVLGVLAEVFLPAPLNIIVPVLPVAAGFFLQRPVIGLYALAFSVPFQSVRAVNVGGVQVTSTEALIALIALTWCTDAALRGRFALPQVVPWRTALLLLGGTMLLSISQASNIVLSLKEMIKWAEMFLVYVLVLLMMRSPRDVVRLFLVLVVAGMTEALVGFAQVLIHGGGVFHAAGVLRAAGTFDQPNPFAGFLNMSLPLVVAALLLKLPRYQTLCRYAAVITGAAVLVSLSRGAWLAILVAVALMVWMSQPRLRMWIHAGIVLLALMVGGSVAGILPDTIANTVATLFSLNQVDVANPVPSTWSIAERLAHWQAGLAMFYDHPILGVGIGNYASAYPQYQVAPVWIYPLGHAHNYYINMAAEAGIIGLVAYLCFLFLTIRLCVRQWRSATTLLGTCHRAWSTRRSGDNLRAEFL